MPRTCTICQHPHRIAIDAALVAGTSYRDIAGQFQVSKTAVARHGGEHIPAAIGKSQEAREEAQALDVVKQLKAINGAALAILTAAKKAGDADTQLKAIDRIHRQIELQAKLLGDLDDRPQVNVLIMPEWLAVRTALLAALAPYSEARAAVASALLVLEASHDAA
jgi:hypothetical protein